MSSLSIEAFNEGWICECIGVEIEQSGNISITVNQVGVSQGLRLDTAMKIVAQL